MLNSEGGGVESGFSASDLKKFSTTNLHDSYMETGIAKVKQIMRFYRKIA
jgi:hypothetical protein